MALLMGSALGVDDDKRAGQGHNITVHEISLHLKSIQKKKILFIIFVDAGCSVRRLRSVVRLAWGACL